MTDSLASPFYRVTVKALVKDGSDRLLVLRTEKGAWELPGGGWEHDEVFETCIQRELQEELGVGVVSIGAVAFMYRGYNRRRGHYSLRIVVPVTLDTYDFTCGDGIAAARFVTKEEWTEMDFVTNEGDVGAYVNHIWPV